MDFTKKLHPNRNAFAADPFGYSSSAWLKWGIAQTVAGFPVDISKPPTAEDLKSPILWLTQAEALTQAAVALIKNQPEFETMPINVRGICDSQYCAVALMLVGYSLEVCLKAMTILRSGVVAYMANEKSFYHHKLVKLAEFMPGLSAKDNAILQTLTHFTLWAGRYPDPGSGRVNDVEEVFSVAEEHEIAAKDLFELAARVMGHTNCVVAEATR
ncbi:hypothetical protein [Pseudomonas kribbensis]|uniref:HEPN domain-containing protein n=1 Tax=Pseudomonas kribbensis TaxID=1628086 RepID=A0A4Y8VEH9_9PSED|nr:hypothetical protein [Pseudomonas kribbensis]TFH79130.1 hypothetical protein E4J90_17795 [Pseudomonas kribbensis]